MKSLAFAITLLASFGVSAQTVIYYEDGSVYTVQPNEKVYVETARKLYTKKGYKNGDEYFRHSLPNQKVDYEEQPYDGEELARQSGVRLTHHIFMPTALLLTIKPTFGN